ncbi:MAG: hypothetical protein VX699_14780 [Myxococcota bacterium]|nr:hypothetical protein [Myxococcota bacterium]
MKNLTIGLALCVVGLGAAFAQQSKRIAQLESRLAGVSSVAGEEPQSVSAPVASASPALRYVAKRDDDIRRRLQALEGKVDRAMRSSGSAAGQGDFGEVEVNGVPRAEAAELHGRSKESLAQAALESPEVMEQLREVIREEQETSRTERWQKRYERRQKIENEELRQIALTARFSDGQLEEVMGAIDGERSTIRVYYQAAHQGETSFNQARSQAAQQRDQTDSAVREILDEEQFEGYMKWRDERNSRRRH